MTIVFLKSISLLFNKILYKQFCKKLNDISNIFNVTKNIKIIIFLKFGVLGFWGFGVLGQKLQHV